MGISGALVDPAEPVSGLDSVTVACTGDLGEGCDAYGTPKTKNGYLDETGRWLDLTGFVPDPEISEVVDKVVARTADNTATGQQV